MAHSYFSWIRKIKWLFHHYRSQQIIIVNAQLWFHSHKVPYQWAAAAFLNSEKISIINYSIIYHPYIWSFMYISVCQDYSNMLVLWAFREGENVYGNGEKYGSYLITIPFSIETMLRLFYYLYKIKILCFGCLFYFSCQTTSNLNENWFLNNFFKRERL